MGFTPGADHRATFTACPPWCIGHVPEREDCLHMSAAETIRISCGPGAAEIMICIQQDRCGCGNPAGAPLIAAYFSDDADPVLMTPSEFRQLGQVPAHQAELELVGAAT